MIYLYSNEIIKNVGSILCNVSFNFFADCLCVVFVFKRRIVSDFNHLQPLSDITVHFRTVTSNFGQKRLLSEIFLYRLSNFIENRSIFLFFFFFSFFLIFPTVLVISSVFCASIKVTALVWAEKFLSEYWNNRIWLMTKKTRFSSWFPKILKSSLKNLYCLNIHALISRPERRTWLALSCMQVSSSQHF